MKKDPAYKSAGKSFSCCYYFSAFLLQYIMLLISFVMENLENEGLPNLNVLFTKKKVIGCLIILFTAISILCLLQIKWDIKTIKNDSGFGGLYNHQLVTISYDKNVGIGEFFNDIVVPIILSLPCTNLPITSLVLLLIVQIATYFFYSRSSDVFPNLSLYLLGYDVYKTSPSSDVNIKYILIRHNSKNKKLNNKERNVIPFVPRSKKSEFAIYVRKDE